MSSSRPNVSVIIPVYNREQFVGQTIDSVLNQTYRDYELIVVDDGSVDQTGRIVSSYGDRVHYIYQSHKGQASARNKGLTAAQGKNILFVDSDDVLLPSHLELLVSCLNSSGDIGVAYSGWECVNEDLSRVLGEFRATRHGQLLEDLLLKRFGLITTGAALIRRECFERAGCFDETLLRGDDADLWLRIARAGYAFGCVEQPLIQYRIHSGGLYGNVDPGDVRDRFTSLTKFFSDDSLSEEIKALEARSFSILHYLTALRYYRSAKVELAKEHVLKAILTYPPLALNREWLSELIINDAMDPRTEAPQEFIRLVFDNLPEEARGLRSVLPLVEGKYNAAVAFIEYHKHRPGQVCKHIIPAVLGYPAILRNRGFISISLRSLFKLFRVKGK